MRQYDSRVERLRGKSVPQGPAQVHPRGLQRQGSVDSAMATSPALLAMGIAMAHGLYHSVRRDNTHALEGIAKQSGRVGGALSYDCFKFHPRNALLTDPAIRVSPT